MRRIQNPVLWACYSSYRQIKAMQDGDANEVWATHGSAIESLGNIAEGGFNRSYKGKNAVAYGQGTYFAKSGNFAYSMNPIYALPDAQGEQHLILATVLQVLL